MQIPAGEFKSKCLKLMDKVKDENMEIVITKYGKPIAKLAPYKKKQMKSCFGCMKDTLIIKGDIVSPIDVKWTGDQENI
ncbi:type II toxin-antitoxin system prevent-host-death family antitoxin [Patescibacteria group bacterium]|nr:type II toxin-antitoxin system prevent-host-death family antitoxin [Patescibacteria group bacterium]